jgi:GxxExxY protein
MVMNENELSRLVIGKGIEVHRTLGPGLLENVYKECLAHALISVGLDVKKEVVVPVVYEDIKLQCGYRIDLLVEDKLVIEVKSVQQLGELHFAQLLTYLKLGDFSLGLLMNFNTVRLIDGCRRVIHGQIGS